MILLLRIGRFTPLLLVLGLFALCLECSPLVTELAQLRPANIDCVKQPLRQYRPENFRTSGWMWLWVYSMAQRCCRP